MSAAWITVIAVGAGTVLLKAVGPVGVANKELHVRAVELLSMVAPAILAALVVTEAFAHGRHLVVDARIAGVAAGGAAALLRAPLWVVVLVGALATAGVRLIS
ncbi:MAG TPA: AzlD domain-containing protein [Gaiellaceae bacterium]